MNNFVEASRSLFQFLLQRADSIESENGVVLGASPPNSGRRRRNTDNSESNEDIDTESRQRGRRGSFICNRMKQVVEVVNFSTKGDDRTIHCGKCIGKNLLYTFIFRKDFTINTMSYTAYKISIQYNTTIPRGAKGKVKGFLFKLLKFSRYKYATAVCYQ